MEECVHFGQGRRFQAPMSVPNAGGGLGMLGVIEEKAEAGLRRSFGLLRMGG